MSLSRLLPLVALLAGCAAPTPAAPAPAQAIAPTFATVLPALTQNVILPTYRTLDEKAAALNAAVTALKAAPTAANLEAARAAWRAARSPWELSETHLFGPAADMELDPALDSWPIDRNALDGVLASGATFSEPFIAEQQSTLKGFHVIEYVLFANAADALTPRKLDYLSALTAEFRTNTAKLLKGWDPAGDNFAAQFAEPTKGGAFGTTDVAFAELLNGMAEICEEVSSGKIETPLAAKDATLEESHFSQASLQDFRNNIQGVQHMYTGQVGDKPGLGVSALVATKDVALDGRVRTLIGQALADLDAVPGTFEEAITKNPESLRKVQASLNAVREILQKDVSVSLTGRIVADAT